MKLYLLPLSLCFLPSCGLLEGYQTFLQESGQLSETSTQFDAALVGLQEVARVAAEADLNNDGEVSGLDEYGNLLGIGGTGGGLLWMLQQMNKGRKEETNDLYDNQKKSDERIASLEAGKPVA